MKRIQLVAVFFLLLLIVGVSTQTVPIAPRQVVIRNKLDPDNLDRTPPVVTITAPTSNTTYDNGSTTPFTTLAGTATDAVGVSSCSWANSATGGSGSASGTTSWSVASISLNSGSNPITVTCLDVAKNQGTDVLTVTYTPGGGDTFTASSCSRNDVNTMLALVGEGDTGVIPAGTCGWTDDIEWTAPVNSTLKGSGSLSTVGGGNVTIIVDDSAINAPLLRITIASTGVFRFAGLTLQGGSGGIKDQGMIQINGPGSTRMDHMRWNMRSYSNGGSKNNKLLLVGDATYGVLDSSILDLFSTSAIYLYNGYGTDAKGDVSWTTATNFGGSNYFFLEDNEINGDVTTIASRTLDCFSASRGVVRFNTMKYVNGPEDHATGHSGDDRGCRSKEGYGNRFSLASGQGAPNYTMFDASSGTALIWGNTADASTIDNFILFNVTRKNNTTYGQTAPPNGWGYCGTAFNGTGSNWDGNTDGPTGYPCLDQPGRGQGQLLVNYHPTKINNSTGTIAWPNQALEPIYIWNNSGTPVNTFYANNSGGRVASDRDYYAQASGIQTNATTPFNGTTGTGWGTLANRPTTCTTGVGYFAVDQGSWNTSSTNPYGVQQNGADGLLYKCSATNTWSLYYTPYTYPHPLRN